MFTPSVEINGGVSLKLTPKDEDDKAIIALMTNGREVKTIKPTEDGGVIIIFQRTGDKQK